MYKFKPGPYEPAPIEPGKPLTFSQTWTFGDIIYSMIPIRLLGGGEFYLRLENLDNLCKTVIGWPDGGTHSGRMRQKDFDLLKPLIEAQDYITKWAVWNGEAITHPLDNICCWFYGNRVDKGHYGRLYALAVGLDPDQWEPAVTQPWLTLGNNEPIRVPGKHIVISKTDRYGNGQVHQVWRNMVEQQWNEQALFVGTAEEHAAFEQDFGIKIQYYPTQDLLELAQVIAGSELYLGNQSVGMAIAQGLGVDFWCDHRKDNCTLEGCETYFRRENGYYF
jgi:hypothetical protein